MIVLDASVVVSAALSPGGAAARAFWQAARNRRVVMSGDVYSEIAAVMLRPKFEGRLGAARRNLILAVLRDEADWVERVDVRGTDCRDAKDTKYLELALAAGASVILSGDADLLVVHPWRGVRIVSPAAFLADAPLT